MELTLIQAIISIAVTLFAGMGSGFIGAVLGIRTINNDLWWMKGRIEANSTSIKHGHSRLDNHIEKFHSK